MTDKQYQILETLVIQPLKSIGAEVYIFGSRLTDKHHPHSDVDILYRVAKGKKTPGTLISEIKEAIEDSNFSFAVDLVDESDLAESYRQHVFETMQML